MSSHDPDETLQAPGSGASTSVGSDGGRFAPGTLLGGRYRIVALLGRGGMGEVYRADDLKLGEAVALKFLSPELRDDGAVLARLHAEVRTARQISHRNVLRVHDLGEVEGEAFLAMEYVDGEDLASLLRRIGRLPAAKATDRPRSWHIEQALDSYLDLQAWQIGQIGKSMAELDAGEGISHEDVKKQLRNWGKGKKGKKAKRAR